MDLFCRCGAVETVPDVSRTLNRLRRKGGQADLGNDRRTERGRRGANRTP